MMRRRLFILGVVALTGVTAPVFAEHGDAPGAAGHGGGGHRPEMNPSRSISPLDDEQTQAALSAERDDETRAIADALNFLQNVHGSGEATPPGELAPAQSIYPTIGRK